MTGRGRLLTDWPVVPVLIRFCRSPTTAIGQASTHGERSLGTFPMRSRWSDTKKVLPEGRASACEARQRCATSSPLLCGLANAACSSCLRLFNSAWVTNCFCCFFS